MNLKSFFSISDDMILPPGVAPEGQPRFGCGNVFLTGATGFLGSYVLAELLEATNWKIFCLVRAESDACAKQRVLAALERTGRNSDSFASRIVAICGTLNRRRFGLDSRLFEILSRSTDRIIHCAAEVSWIKPYRKLRGGHVFGTLNVIDLASTGCTKHVSFVSSLSVCYAADGPEKVDETTDMAPWVARIPLGYAQAKCVAETLLRQAADRGVPVSILRCGLICGDTKSGTSNHDDLISRLLRGGIMSGVVPDIDWCIDAVPVDAAASIVCEICEDCNSGLTVLHLHQDEACHWREMALWLRLKGYQIRFVSLEDWLYLIKTDGSERAPDLYLLHPFLLARPEPLNGKNLIELYFEASRKQIRSIQSWTYLKLRGITIPRLDAELLDRYLSDFVASGHLPPIPRQINVHSRSLKRMLEEGHGRWLNRSDIEIGGFEAVLMADGSGILSDLSCVQTGGQAGLWRCRGRLKTSKGSKLGELDLVLKIRPADHVQDRAIIALADLCDKELGRSLSANLEFLPHRGGLHREIAIYSDTDLSLSRFAPKFFGSISDEGGEQIGYMSERLSEVDLLDSADTPELWSAIYIEAAVRGLADMHSVWFGREAELSRHSAISSSINGPRTPRLCGLWRDMARFSAERFSLALGEQSLNLQLELVNNLAQWWHHWMNMRRTLVHNDFNPRNIAFRRTTSGPVLCTYDWELAAAGIPQYDLAEFFCFVLPEGEGPSATMFWLELHRSGLRSRTGKEITEEEYLLGFALSLRYLMVNRLPFYALIDRIRPQRFLSRIVRNWRRLHDFAEKRIATERPFGYGPQRAVRREFGTAFPTDK